MSYPISKLVNKAVLEKFNLYQQLLNDWNGRTLLVQDDTLKNFNERHLLDSLQIIPILGLYAVDMLSLDQQSSNQAIPVPVVNHPLSQPLELIKKLDDYCSKLPVLSIIDVGTGAGFPGMVLAMCGIKNITLCESNYKKCLFLEEVSRLTSTKVHIVNERVENHNQKYDVILSRAMTQLIELCQIASFLMSSPKSIAIFHKGRKWQDESVIARSQWDFSCLVYSSISAPDSVLYVLQSL